MRVSLTLLQSALLMLPLAPASLRGDDERVKYDISQISSSVGGVLVYVPERWGLLHLNLSNPLDRETEILCATAFDQEASLQYGRRIWLPPRSRMKTWHLVRLPRPAGDGTTKLGFRTSVMEAAGGSEALIRDDAGKMQLSSFLVFSTPGAVTGMIGPQASGEESDRKRSENHHLVTAARTFAAEQPRIVELSDPVIPVLSESLQSIEQLVIADGHLQTDDVAVSAIRRWLYSGGRLWVLLEQVDPRFMELLLGDEWPCQIVDRVGLTTVHLRSAVPHLPKTEHSADFEQPVDLVRTIVADGEVRYTVDGWPAAIWKKCGHGMLLVTTLGPRGWVRDRTDAEIARLQGKQALNPYVATEPLSHATIEMFGPKSPEAMPTAALEPQMRDYVGYGIPSRQVVIGLLGGFGILLAGGGVWLWRAGRLEWFGLYGTLVATATSIVLVAIGRQHRYAVPPTVSQVQIIEPIPGTDDILARGTAGVFTNDTGIATFEGSGGGWLIPDMAGSTGTTRRLVWTDLDRWRWENLPQSAGLRSATFVASKQLPDRAASIATFGPRGVTGRLSLPAGMVAEDVVLATRDGRVGVSIGPDGKFSASADQTLSREQYISAGLLSDEQHRRSQTLHELLGQNLQAEYPERPVLLFWTPPWNAGLEFGPVSRQAGSALIALPLRFERPAEGTVVTIPPPLLTYRGALGPDGFSPTGLYDHRKREWVEKTGSTSSWIRFQVPPVLLPVEPLVARLVVKVAGPVGKLQVSGWNGDRVTPVKTWIDPVGTMSFDLTDRQLMQLTPDGGLFLLVTGGDPDRPELTTIPTDQGMRTLYWQIDSLTLELQARVGSGSGGMGTSAEARSGE